MTWRGRATRRRTITLISCRFVHGYDMLTQNRRSLQRRNNSPRKGRAFNDQPQAENSAARRAIVVAYADFDTLDGRHVLAGDILRTLIGRGYWLTPRVPVNWAKGMRVLFYQSKLGFTASGSLTRVTVSRAEDWRLPGNVPSTFFPLRLELRDVEIFAVPLNARPLVNRLSFITDKKNWGQAFRFSPRLIPKQDADAILRELRKNQTLRH